MAADKTGVNAVTDTLVASTVRKINLTGVGGRVELIHQSAVTNPVYYGFAESEATLPALTVGGNEARCLLAGERLTVNLPRSRNASGSLWMNFISAGAAVISIETLPGGT